MFRNQLIIQQAGREGSRHAALGRTTSEIAARVQASMADLPLDRLTIVQEYRTLSGTSWSSWGTLGNTTNVPITNNAPQGAQVRVRLTFTHRLLTGPLFARMIGQPGATSLNLHAQMVMRRE